MILERSKTETVLPDSTLKAISFTKEFVKPGSSSGLPRLSNRASAVATRTGEATEHAAAATTTAEPNVSARGMSVTAHPVMEQMSPVGLGSHQPLLNRRQRTFVSFHCSPFDTGSVRVAASAPNAPIKRETTVVYNTPYGWVPPIIAVSHEIPSRLEPIHPLPPAPQRQHTTWETVDGHWRNEQRANYMKRLQHINSNEMLAKFYYGTKDEIDSYKRHMRGILKEQMEDSWNKSRKRFHVDLSESMAAINYDRECLAEDKRADWQKRMYLRQFAYDNRKLADDKQQRVTQDVKREAEKERRLLEYNPINWSGTLT